MRVEREPVAHREAHAVTGLDQQRLAFESADVVFAAQHEARRATVGGHLPGARCGEGGNRIEALDHGCEFALGEFFPAAEGRACQAGGSGFSSCSQLHEGLTMRGLTGLQRCPTR